MGKIQLTEELRLVAKKLAKEEIEMKQKGEKYLTEEKALAKYKNRF